MTRRYDRTGEPYDEDDEQLELDVVERVPRVHDCNDGWLGDDDEGRPRPCPVCRAKTNERRFKMRERWDRWWS